MCCNMFLFPWAPEGPPLEWLTLLLVQRFKDPPFCHPVSQSSSNCYCRMRIISHAGRHVSSCAVQGSRQEKAEGGRSLLGLAPPSPCEQQPRQISVLQENSCLLDLLSPSGGTERLPSMQPSPMVCREGVNFRAKKRLPTSLCVFFFCALKSSLCCQCFVSLM